MNKLWLYAIFNQRLKVKCSCCVLLIKVRRDKDQHHFFLPAFSFFLFSQFVQAKLLWKNCCFTKLNMVALFYSVGLSSISWILVSIISFVITPSFILNEPMIKTLMQWQIRARNARQNKMLIHGHVNLPFTRALPLLMCKVSSAPSQLNELPPLHFPISKHATCIKSSRRYGISKYKTTKMWRSIPAILKNQWR